MAKKKKSVGFYAISEVMEPYVISDPAAIEDILGYQFDDEFFEDLGNEMTQWIMCFIDFRQLQYGEGERRLAEKARNAADTLAATLDELGGLGNIVLDRYAYRERVKNDSFVAVLRGLNEMVDYLDEFARPEINVAGFQIHAVAGLLKDYGVHPAVAHNTGGSPFQPSAFVRLIDHLWEEEPRLRLRPRANAGYWENLSQWVSARLRETVNFDQLKLTRREKLK